MMTPEEEAAIFEYALKAIRDSEEGHLEVGVFQDALDALNIKKSISAVLMILMDRGFGKFRFVVVTPKGEEVENPSEFIAGIIRTMLSDDAERWKATKDSIDGYEWHVGEAR